MKKILHFFIAIGLLSLNSCAGPDVTLPACDNTTIAGTITLDWSDATYVCPYQGDGSVPIVFDPSIPPPTATEFNYINYASFNSTSPADLVDPDAYICSFVVNNAQSINTPCTNPGSMAGYWQTPGASENTLTYSNQDAQISVDYYDVCRVCTETGGNARPHFTGTMPFPPGVTSVKMKVYTDAPYYTNPLTCN